MFRQEYIIPFFDSYGAATAKYGVSIALYNDRNGTFRRLGMTQVLSPVWSFGEKAIDEAEALANQAPK